MNDAIQAVQSAPADAVDKNYYRVTIRAPIHKVWAELTRENTVLPFFFNSVCKTPDGLKLGAPVRMVSKNGKHAAVVGDVIDFEPPYRYAHTFQFTSLEDAPCIIRYELKEVADGTEFTLISERVPAGTKSEKYMESGGQFITNNFKAFVETGKATPGGRFALAMMGLTAFMTPASCRIENWPFDRKINVD